MDYILGCLYENRAKTDELHNGLRKLQEDVNKIRERFTYEEEAKGHLIKALSMVILDTFTQVEGLVFSKYLSNGKCAKWYIEYFADENESYKSSDEDAQECLTKVLMSLPKDRFNEFLNKL